MLLANRFWTAPFYLLKAIDFEATNNPSLPAW
jgi:hypothetical protein